MFLSCKGSTEKSLADYLLRDDSRLKEGVQPAKRGCARAINPGGICCDQIFHKPDFKLWSRSMFVWGYLGLLWVLICLGLLSGDARPKSMRLKSMVPTMPHFFRLGSSAFLGWKNSVFLTCLSLGTRDC